ncbi:MAG: sulfate transporter [Lachnospiraceae bacterium]|nr:sulfate transporter [Lachnospiraceae bacterium]
MIKHNISYRILRLMLAMILGIFLSAFSFGVSTAHAAEEVQAEVAEQQEAGAAEDGGGAVIILMGGMLLIIIAVVISVVVTVVSTAPIADEL